MSIWQSTRGRAVSGLRPPPLVVLASDRASLTTVIEAFGASGTPRLGGEATRSLEPTRHLNALAAHARRHG